MKEDIRNRLLEAGASSVGFSSAGNIDQAVAENFDRLIGEGWHGEMSYLSRHAELRKNTGHILSGASTVISLAFGYRPSEWLPEGKPMIASYAYGDDYHVVIREKLFPVIKSIQDVYGGKWRLCIDSAPLSERYWAVTSGIGIRGLNGAVITPQNGCLCFLAEILTTLSIESDRPMTGDCGKCGRCLDACPAGALNGDGMVTAKKCINYLTIEKKGEFTEEEKKLLRKDGGYLYGCDRCLRVCPHNQGEGHDVTSVFCLREEIASLTPEKIMEMDEEEFKRIFKRSPLLYAGYERLRRNASVLLNRY